MTAGGRPSDGEPNRPDEIPHVAAPETFMPPPPGDPPRNVSNAPTPPEIIESEARTEESQWSLIAREFKKRKGAVAAGWTILLLVTVAVFAPLLANDRPIAYRGANRFAYSEAARNVRVLLSQAVEAEDQSSVDEIVTIIERQMNWMAGAVVPETAEELIALRERIAEEANNGLTADKASEFQRDLRSYPADEVSYIGSWRFPVFSVLRGTAIGFMLLNLLVILLLMARAVVRSSWPKKTRRAVLLTLLVVPVFVGLAWELLVPSLVDRTPYKLGISAADASEMPNAAVIYETAIWPLVPFGLDEVNLDEKLARPAFLLSKEDRGVEGRYDAPHWLGTDKIGRDVLSRMLWGGRVSLAVGIVSVAIYVAIGIVVGAVAGYFRGWVDMVVSRVIEIVIVFPAFFLILTIIAFLGPSLWNIMIVIGLTGWTGVARLIRGEFLRLADQEFVVAGRALGYKAPRLIFRHILPNAMAPVLVAATFGVAGAILTESSLSFLGIGITVPTPSWGGILAEGRDYREIAPWLIYMPGFTIFLTILSYNLAGEALRDASDPRLRGSR